MARSDPLPRPAAEDLRVRLTGTRVGVEPQPWPAVCAGLRQRLDGRRYPA